jgi:outer membrane cobalamin receptor
LPAIRSKSVISSPRIRALSVASSLAIGVTLAGPAAAQETEEPEAIESPGGTTDAAADEIVVTGFRASLQSAQRIKRDADTVVDVITAEDIGALADRSVAEAL